jgi:SAM-dependent methyltransferase
VSEDRPTVSEANQELIDRLRDAVAQLQAEQGDTVPAGEPYLASGSRLKAAAKRGVFRVTRPATRRSDRLASELAATVLELAQQVSAIAADVERIHGDVDRLDRAVHDHPPGGHGQPSEPEAPHVDDAYYWSFEERMRGDAASVIERLQQYERFAVPLRERFEAGPDAGHRDEPEPMWLDLGCGLGEFCELVREWGFRVQGVDSSPEAVDACRAKGIDATLAEAGDYLETRRDEPPAAVSAIQLIEHLPRGQWLGLLRRIHEILRPGGAALVETINGMNPEAVTAYFVADVTHTWPGHPETLRLMAEHAGFTDVQVLFLNPDQRGNAQDFAIWGVKARDEQRGGTASG